MKFTSKKLKPLIVALGMSTLLVTGSSFAERVPVTTNKTITGKKPYIPYVHVKSSSGYLRVGSTLSFTGTGTAGYVLKKDWTPEDEAALAIAVQGNTAASGGVSGINNADGSMVFVDKDGDNQTFLDRFNSNKVMVEWYKIPETIGMGLTPAEITADLVAAGATPPARWTYLGNTADYTLQIGDINDQIAAVIIPITGTGDPDRNSALVIGDVLKFAGQKIDPTDPGGDKVDPTNPLPPGPNPDITPPKGGGSGVEPKVGADLRLVIHTDKAYHDAYVAYLTDPANPLPPISSITADEIFADSLDKTAGVTNTLKTNTTYYATVLATSVEGSTNPADYTTDVTNAYKNSLVWSYVDTNSSTAFEIDNDTKMAFRTLRDSNLASGKGDIDGSATAAGNNPVNDGSVKARVKNPTAIEASTNLSAGGLGLNEQGFRIGFSVDNQM